MPALFGKHESQVRQNLRRVRRQRQRTAETRLGAWIAYSFLADRAVVPDLRRRIRCDLDQPIVGNQRLRVATLHEQQMGKVGQRCDFVRPPLQNVAVATLCPRLIAAAVELGAEVDEQPGVPGENLQRALEHCDGDGWRISFSQKIAEIEQRLAVTRLEILRQRLLDEGNGRCRRACRQRAARLLQERVGAGHRRAGFLRTRRAGRFRRTGTFAAPPSLPAAGA